jgi:hypothetical protein
MGQWPAGQERGRSGGSLGPRVGRSRDSTGRGGGRRGRGLSSTESSIHSKESAELISALPRQPVAKAALPPPPLRTIYLCALYSALLSSPLLSSPLLSSPIVSFQGRSGHALRPLKFPRRVAPRSVAPASLPSQLAFFIIPRRLVRKFSHLKYYAFSPRSLLGSAAFSDAPECFPNWKVSNKGCRFYEARSLR